MNRTIDIIDGLAAASGGPRENVQRLIGDLRDALVACGEGPLRVTIDSDGAARVQPLTGRPFIRGQRLTGVPVLMSRIAKTPEAQDDGLAVVWGMGTR